MRGRLLFLALIAMVPVTTAHPAHAQSVPGDNSAIGQYVEDVPGAGGSKPTDPTGSAGSPPPASAGAGADSAGGSAGAAPSGANGDEGVGPGRDPDEAGSGAGAEATRPGQSPDRAPEPGIPEGDSATGREMKHSELDDAGGGQDGSGLGTVLAAAVGGDGAGMGIALPLIIVLSGFAAIVVAASGIYRRRAEGDA